MQEVVAENGAAKLAAATLRTVLPVLLSVRVWATEGTPTTVGPKLKAVGATESEACSPKPDSGVVWSPRLVPMVRLPEAAPGALGLKVTAMVQSA